MDYSDNLENYLKSIKYHIFQQKGFERTWNPIKKDLKKSNHRYLVLYGERNNFKLSQENGNLTCKKCIEIQKKMHDQCKYFTFHTVNDIEQYKAMVKYEIYGSVRVVDLQDLTEMVNFRQQSPVKTPFPWEHNYWDHHGKE